jgi:ribosomal protein L37AE/L43A
MAKIFFFTTMFFAFIMIAVSLIIMQARLHPERDSAMTNAGIKILNLLHSNNFKKAMSIAGKIVVILSVIAIVGFYVYALPKNFNADKYVDKYINNSIEIEIAVNKLDTFSNGKYFKSYAIHTGVSIAFRRAKLHTTYCYSILFYEEEHEKYFTFMSMVPYSRYVGLETFIRHFNGKILASVNKSDMENPDYGTKDNPIPILMFDIPNATHPDYLRDKLTEKDYRNAVYGYLSNIMSKAEFRERFKNGKEFDNFDHVKQGEECPFSVKSAPINSCDTMSIQEKIDKEAIKCPVCKDKFITYIGDGTEQIWVCGECGNVWSNKSELDNAIKQKHSQ